MCQCAAAHSHLADAMSSSSMPSRSAREMHTCSSKLAPLSDMAFGSALLASSNQAMSGWPLRSAASTGMSAVPLVGVFASMQCLSSRMWASSRSLFIAAGSKRC